MTRRHDWSNVAFLATLALLTLLGAWWTILIGRLVAENHALEVRVYGATPAIEAALRSRRLMLMGESGTMTILALSLVVLAYRFAMRERAQAHRLEGVLAASTHELKTPIAGVKALLESLQSGVLPPERAAPHLAAGLDAVARLEHLVEGIVAYQAAVARRPEAFVARPLAELVAEIVRHRADTISGESVSVELGESVSVEVRRDGFRVVMENLLDNARKYGGSEPVRVTARIGDRVELMVSDAGEGFDPATAEDLFQPYRRGASGRAAHGTGLGLYLARQLAREMGGDLSASSEGVGRGARFTLFLRKSLRKADG